MGAFCRMLVTSGLCCRRLGIRSGVSSMRWPSGEHNEYLVLNGFEQQNRRCVQTVPPQPTLTCRCQMGDNCGRDVCHPSKKPDIATIGREIGLAT
jgi:hypothetical protein